MTERLRIALQKKGRLADDSFALLKKCGLRFAIRGGGLLARVKNMPIDLLLVRDDDIPSFVANDAADIGIVGENVLVEEQLVSKEKLDAEITMRLGFSRCKLCLACDLVSSGATLEANGLTAFETILKSEAVLIQSGRTLSAEKQALLDKLMRRIDGVIKSAETKYIML